MEKKDLTVVITTYNRKCPLLEQLRSLELQGHFDKYEIIISDNHSNYNVQEWLSSNLSSDFFEIVKVVSRDYNVGGDTNITLAFQLPRTRWMWLLSDDDVTEPNSLQIVLNDIKTHDKDETCWIKYSISGHYRPNDDIVIDNIRDVFHYYSNNRSAGEMIFMSNNVYCLPYIQDHFAEICMYNDTCMSQIVLPLFAIKKNHKKVWFSSKSITNYTPNRISYELLYAYLRLGNTLYILPLNYEKDEIEAFRQLTFFTPRSIVSSLITIEDNYYRWLLFVKILHSHYSFFSFKRAQAILYYLIMRIIGDKKWLQLRNKRSKNRILK